MCEGRSVCEGVVCVRAGLCVEGVVCVRAGLCVEGVVCEGRSVCGGSSGS